MVDSRGVGVRSGGDGVDKTGIVTGGGGGR